MWISDRDLIKIHNNLIKTVPNQKQNYHRVAEQFVFQRLCKIYHKKLSICNRRSKNLVLNVTKKNGNNNDSNRTSEIEI
jgi:hypothetical protein